MVHTLCITYTPQKLGQHLLIRQREYFCSKIWYWSSNSINNDSKVFSQCGSGFVTIGRQYSSDFLAFLQGPSLLSKGIDKLCSEMIKIANKPWKLERVSAYDKERECLPPRRHSRIVKLPQRWPRGVKILSSSGTPKRSSHHHYSPFPELGLSKDD